MIDDSNSESESIPLRVSNVNLKIHKIPIIQMLADNRASLPKTLSSLQFHKVLVFVRILKPVHATVQA